MFLASESQRERGDMVASENNLTFLKQEIKYKSLPLFRFQFPLCEETGCLDGYKVLSNPSLL